MVNDTIIQAPSNGDIGAVSFSGNTTLTDVTISVVELTIKEKYSVNQLNTKITQMQMRAGSDPSNELPYRDVMVGLKQKSVGMSNDKLLWQANIASGGTGLNFFDGWLTKIKAGSYVSGATTGALASGTCISQMNDLYKLAITNFPLWEQGCFLFLNPTNYAVYFRAIFNLTGVINTLTMNTEGLPDAFTIPGTNCLVQSCFGLIGDNSKVITRDGNLVVGTDLVSETDLMQLAYDDSSAVMAYRLFAIWKLGAQIARPQECILAA